MAESMQEWKLPKNVRQIGEGSSQTKIYVEDYVVTYLRQLTDEKPAGKAVLFGEIREKNLCPYIFISGAMEVATFSMDAQARNDLLEQMQKYFEGKMVVGWFLVSAESPFCMKDDIVEIFCREFPDENQVLLVEDNTEHETFVFLMEGEEPAEQPGYYIYYEKNTQMQSFMIAVNTGKSVEEETPVKDSAIKRFRKVIQEKEENREQKKEQKKEQKAEENEKQPHQVNLPLRGRMVYMAGGFLVMTVMALGVTMVYNYDRMREVERSLASLTGNVESQMEYVNDNAEEVMLHIDEEADLFPADPEGEAESEDVKAESVESETEMTADTESQERDVAASSANEAANKTENRFSQGPETENASDQNEDNGALQENTAEMTESEQSESIVSTAGTASSSYIVKVGDTLAGICEMYYGTSDKLPEICSLNGISDENTILPGQKILLP